MRKLLIALIIVVSIGVSGVVRAQDWERATKLFRSAAVTARTSPSFLRCNGSPSSSSTTVRNWIDCFGTFTLFGGNKYIGDFRNGKFYGQGTYTYADGRVAKGTWENNKFLYAQKPRRTDSDKGVH